MHKATYSFSQITGDLTQLVKLQSEGAAKERMGIVMPKFLIKELNRITLPRQRSRFIAYAIAKAIDEKLSQREKHELAKKYQTFAKRSARLAEDWHALDLNDWDHAG